MRQKRCRRPSCIAEKEESMNSMKRFNCIKTLSGTIISNAMNRSWMMSVCLVISIAATGLSAQRPSPTHNTQALLELKKAQTVKVANTDRVAPPFVLARKGQRTVINGREWPLSDLRPAWASSQRSAQRIPTPSSRTRAQRSRVAQVSSSHRNH